MYSERVFVKYEGQKRARSWLTKKYFVQILQKLFAVLCIFCADCHNRPYMHNDVTKLDAREECWSW